MKKYIFLDFDGVISQMKRWFYGALKFIAVYILMVMLFMAYFYWYPEKEMNNMNRRAIMYQNTLSLSLRLLPTITLSERRLATSFLHFLLRNSRHTLCDSGIHCHIRW